MVYLQFNTANQTAFFTLDEGRRYFTDAFTHYLCVLKKADGTTGLDGQGINQVLNVVNENQRITEVTMTSVGLTNSGQYAYYIFGQNSSSNIDPEHSSVVGLVEMGTLIVENEASEVTTIDGQIEITTIQ